MVRYLPTGPARSVPVPGSRLAGVRRQACGAVLLMPSAFPALKFRNLHHRHFDSSTARGTLATMSCAQPDEMMPRKLLRPAFG